MGVRGEVNSTAWEVVVVVVVAGPEERPE